MSKCTPRILPVAFSLVLLCLGCASVRAQSCPVNLNQAATIAAGDPTQTGRVTRDGVPSDCNGKAYPGAFDTVAGRRFDSYSFTNTNASPICVQVTLNGSIAGLHSVAYLNSYNPANIQQNYVGDLGVIYTANTNASYSFLVPAGAPFAVVVHETTANGPTANYTVTVGCTAVPPPQPTAGQLLISEFRLAGPGASGAGTVKDEYIELYNNTDGTLTIGNYRLGGFDPNFFGPADGADFFFTIPAGTTIPARGHYLIADTSTDVESYSLTAYAAASSPITCGAGCDFYIDNEGIQLLTPTSAAVEAVIDSVGFTGSGGRPGEVNSYPEGTALPRRTQVNPTVQYAYVRKMTSGTPQDTNNNANDFALVSVTGAALPLAAGGTQQSVLGAPGPESATSPAQRNATVKSALLDVPAGQNGAANRVRDTTSGGAGTPTAFGTLKLRRKFTNSGANPVTQIRWRVVDVTTLGGISAGQADLRVVASSTADFNVTVTGGGSVPVKGTQVEQPPTQALGGGLNSSIITITPATPIAAGTSVNVEFTLGVAAGGSYRFFINTEALPGPPGFAPAPLAAQPAEGLGGNTVRQPFVRGDTLNLQTTPRRKTQGKGRN